MTVPAAYRPLHKYLNGRFADSLVLTFAQIEDLLGFSLPSAARTEQGWWAAAAADGTPSEQSSSWLAANRVATANLPARTVLFDRGPA